MRVFAFLVILFVGMSIAEITLLLTVGGFIGVFPTVALILFTGIVGAHLVRLQGLRTLNKLNQQLNAGTMPAGALIEAGCLLVAGALLITPGFITDIVGFAILIPPVRNAFARYMAKIWIDKLKQKGQVHSYETTYHHHNRNGQKQDYIEGEFERKD